MINLFVCFSYSSSSGMLVEATFQLGPIPPDYLPVEPMMRQEDVPVPFDCPQGCGGAERNIYDNTIYPFGTCIEQDLCE